MKLKKIFYILLSISIFTLLYGCSQEESEQLYLVSGYVLNENNEAVSEATIYTDNVSTKTDANGLYQLPALSIEEQITIYVDDELYLSDQKTIRVDEVSENEYVANFTLKLKSNIYGVIKDDQGLAINNVKVYQIGYEDLMVYSNPFGQYNLDVILPFDYLGQSTIVYEKDGMIQKTVKLYNYLLKNKDLEQNVRLHESLNVSIKVVSSEDQNEISEVKVKINNLNSYYTNDQGIAIIPATEEMTKSNYQIQVSRDGFVSKTIDIDLTDSLVEDEEIVIEMAPGFYGIPGLSQEVVNEMPISLRDNWLDSKSYVGNNKISESWSIHTSYILANEGFLLQSGRNNNPYDDYYFDGAYFDSYIYNKIEIQEKTNLFVRVRTFESQLDGTYKTAPYLIVKVVVLGENQSVEMYNQIVNSDDIENRMIDLSSFKGKQVLIAIGSDRGHYLAISEISLS